jgi:hypothetical protein
MDMASNCEWPVISYSLILPQVRMDHRQISMLKDKEMSKMQGTEPEKVKDRYDDKINETFSE